MTSLVKTKIMLSVIINKELLKWKTSLCKLEPKKIKMGLWVSNDLPIIFYLIKGGSLGNDVTWKFMESFYKKKILDKNGKLRFHLFQE